MVLLQLKGILVSVRQIRYTVFVAVPSIRLCRGGRITFAQGGDAPTSSPAATLFYAGEIPAVSYPNSRGEELQIISFQRIKAPISDRNNGGNRGERNKPAQADKTPTWGISRQMSESSSPATHIEQRRIELPLHKKGDKPSGHKTPAQIPYGSRYGSAAKSTGNHRKTKTPGNRMNTRFPGAFTGRSDR